MSYLHTEQVNRFADDLIKNIRSHSKMLPIKTEAHRFIDDVIKFLFPHFSEKYYYTKEEIEAKLIIIQRNLKNILLTLKRDTPMDIDEVSKNFILSLPEVYDSLWSDAEAIYAGDPAAESIEEVILAYPGFLAIAVYRIAHTFYLLKVPVFPRLLTEYAHQVTGVDIHPGATIGNSFMIDHGTGVVIGETTVIGEHVKIYQGVTLGALSVSKKKAGARRHPTIEDNVVIYAHATILGGETVIGKNSTIGGNVWLTSSVPPDSVVYHKSQVVMKSGNDDFCEPEYHI